MPELWGEALVLTGPGPRPEQEAAGPAKGEAAVAPAPAPAFEFELAVYEDEPMLTAPEPAPEPEAPAFGPEILASEIAAEATLDAAEFEMQPTAVSVATEPEMQPTAVSVATEPEMQPALAPVAIEPQMQPTLVPAATEPGMEPALASVAIEPETPVAPVEPEFDTAAPEVASEEAEFGTISGPAPVTAEFTAEPGPPAEPMHTAALPPAEADLLVATAPWAQDVPATLAAEVNDWSEPQAATQTYDPFREIIERHRAAASERAQRDWGSERRIYHDQAPMLGDMDSDFVPATGGARPPMSLDVQGAAVQTILRSIAEYAGVNIVADKDVAGVLTLRALDLPWPEMLQTVCRATGLVAIDHGTVIRVATERVAQEEKVARESSARKQEEFLPLETRVVHLEYAQAAELKDVADALRGQRGKVEIEPRTNALVISDIPPKLDLLEQTLVDLDTQTMQIEITAEIVDIDFTDSRQLGISWGLSNMHSASANASGNLAVTSPSLVDPPLTGDVGVLRSFGELQARIEALASMNKADIISTPRITTVNNRVARILVGKEVPLITMDQAGNTITELKKVGISLEVTPFVNSDEQITLELHPEVSDLSSQSTVQGGVVFTTTLANTRVMVTEGETVVIGGLIRSLEGEFERGVPFIKDVPLLGHLFKYSDTRKEKRELLIFVTPRLVRATAHQG